MELAIQPVQLIVGYLLILVGLALVILAVLVTLGVIKVPDVELSRQATFLDLLLALLKKAPWFGVVGLFLIYAGLKLVGVYLPF